MDLKKRATHLTATLLCAMASLFLNTAHGLEFGDRAARLDSIIDRWGETLFTLRPEDAPTDDSARALRAEEMPPMAQVGKWYRYTWETWLPADTPISIQQDVLALQWKNRIGGPRISIHLNQGEWYLKVNVNKSRSLRYPIDAELVSWKRWDMYVYWSTKDNGYVRIVAGDAVLQHRGANIWPDSTSPQGAKRPHWSFGLYRPQWKHGKLASSDEPNLRKIKFRNYHYEALTREQWLRLGLPNAGSYTRIIQAGNTDGRASGEAGSQALATSLDPDDTATVSPVCRAVTRSTCNANRSYPRSVTGRSGSQAARQGQGPVARN